jgi:hypothetical protein
MVLKAQLCKNRKQWLAASLAGLLIISYCFPSPLRAADFQTENISDLNQDSTSQPKINKRLWGVGSGHVLLYTGTLTVLDRMWYRDFPRSGFHFHNDLPDWLQMDKVAHAANAYQLSRLSYYTFRWSGLNNNYAAIWGSISGNIFLTTVEIMDGFSAEWGASLSDFAANTLGSLSFFAQQMAWQEQKIVWKYSFSQSGLQRYRPDLLGSNLPENILKDYNGLTFWLSFNISALTGGNNSIPPWLNVALGYGAMGMLGGRENPADHNEILLPQMARYRQFYLAPDIDFARIPTQNQTLKQILNTINFIKLPTPALEYNQEQGFSFHLLFF